LNYDYLASVTIRNDHAAVRWCWTCRGISQWCLL
jgi:hypothetical protein